MVPAVTWAVRVQAPAPAKATVRPFPPTVQTVPVLELTDLVPSPVVLTAAVKEPPTSRARGDVGDGGGLGVPGLTGMLCGLPSAAP